MAKRKRLSPAAGLAEVPPGAAEGTEMQGFLYGVEGAVRRSGPPALPPASAPPVARIAAETAARAALDDLAAEVAAARSGGRMIVDLPLAAVAAGHLMRDRLAHDPEEMAVLKASLAAQGQQVPIEVVDLGQGRYGLIAGARRLAALEALAAETGEARFSQVQALIRPRATAPDAYRAMVEENEIRAGLTFYERGRLVAEAARMGLFVTIQAAAKHLFGSVPPARRSKVLSFAVLHQGLGGALAFPGSIPEHLGLALAAALQGDPGFGERLRDRLAAAPAATPAAERAVLEAALRAGTEPDRRDTGEAVGAGLRLEGRTGRAVLTGPGVTAEFLAALRDWLAARGD
jgi:ParB family transcriptional regulator, chromosome partitioning protein